MCCPLCKILETILKMDEGRTSRNGSKDKKANDNVQDCPSEKWHRQTINAKKKKQEEDLTGLMILYMYQYEDTKLF